MMQVEQAEKKRRWFVTALVLGLAEVFVIAAVVVRYWE